MRYILWPANTVQKPEIWRVLDLSGLTNNTRQSRNYTKAGFVYYNGNRVYNLKKTTDLGKIFTLELRFPNGRVKTEDIYLYIQDRNSRMKARSNTPRELHYKG